MPSYMYTYITPSKRIESLHIHTLHHPRCCLSIVSLKREHSRWEKCLTDGRTDCIAVWYDVWMTSGRAGQCNVYHNISIPFYVLTLYVQRKQNKSNAVGEEGYISRKIKHFCIFWRWWITLSWNSLLLPAFTNKLHCCPYAAALDASAAVTFQLLYWNQTESERTEEGVENV